MRRYRSIPLFVAEAARIPDLHFPDSFLDVDHDWHEFHRVICTTEQPNDTKNRSIEEFIKELRYVGKDAGFYLRP